MRCTHPLIKNDVTIFDDGPCDGICGSRTCPIACEADEDDFRECEFQPEDIDAEYVMPYDLSCTMAHPLTISYVNKTDTRNRRCIECDHVVLRIPGETGTYFCLFCDERVDRGETYLGRTHRPQELIDILDTAETLKTNE